MILKHADFFSASEMGACNPDKFQTWEFKFQQWSTVKKSILILMNFSLRAVYCAPVKEIPKEMDEESIKENRRKKNCEAARISRRKKKEYVSGLENRVIALERENKVLQAEIRKIKEMYCQNPALNQPQ